MQTSPLAEDQDHDSHDDSTERTMAMNVRFPADLRARLDDLARRQRRSINSQIIYMLEQQLQREGMTPGA